MFCRRLLALRPVVNATASKVIVRRPQLQLSLIPSRRLFGVTSRRALLWKRRAPESGHGANSGKAESAFQRNHKRMRLAAAGVAGVLLAGIGLTCNVLADSGEPPKPQDKKQSQSLSSAAAAATATPASKEHSHGIQWPSMPHITWPHLFGKHRDEPLVAGGAVGPAIENLPVLPCPISFAPEVPPPIDRKFPALLKLDMTCDVVISPLTNKWKYRFWTFNKQCPGPMIRCRVGDVIHLNMTNNDMTGMPHNVDFHAVTGPGGGAGVTLAESGQTKSATFRMLEPGLFVYHCAAAPVPMHIANGMYGLILVEPEEGLPKVDREFYVMQSEFYFDEPDRSEIDPDTGKPNEVAEFSYGNGLREQADAVVFNGREGSLTQERVLKANTGERVRIYFGNAGPNLVSSFHVIGATFDKVYMLGDLVSAPARKLQTVTVPAGGSVVVDIPLYVPGNFTLVDHSIFRMDKGAVGFLSVSGPKAPGVYEHATPAEPCPNCKLHP